MRVTNAGTETVQLLVESDPPGTLVTDKGAKGSTHLVELVPGASFASGSHLAADNAAEAG